MDRRKRSLCLLQRQGEVGGGGADPGVGVRVHVPLSSVDLPLPSEDTEQAVYYGIKL